MRLRGKVKTTFTPDEEPDRMPLLLLNRLINEAEGQVEMELSTRYLAPFQTVRCQDFSQLPERPTKEVIRTLCELLAVIRVLETDFGRGSSVDSSKYSDSCQKRYNMILYGDSDKRIPGLLSVREDTFNIFSLPPLPGLKSNYQMAAVDTGFAGYIDRSDDYHHEGSAAEQINDPFESYWNGSIGHYREDFS